MQGTLKTSIVSQLLNTTGWFASFVTHTYKSRLSHSKRSLLHRTSRCFTVYKDGY